MSDQQTTETEVITTPAIPKEPSDYFNTFDTSITYEYKQRPDIVSGRCDNCGNAHFESTVNNGKFLRECRNCGMKKYI